jgi:hypothetical protein
MDTAIIPGIAEVGAQAVKATREEWLRVAVETLRPIIAAKGFELPRVRCSVGFPKGHGRMDRVIGQCWSKLVSADGTFEIFITPTLDNPARVLDILVHELGHACLPDAGHKKPFADYCRAMRLNGPWTATTAGPEFGEEIARPVFAAQSFDYPHARMLIDSAGRGMPQPKAPGDPGDDPEEPGGRIGKQGTRMHKRACKVCGYTVRLSHKWLAKGSPLCGNVECAAFQTQMEGE